MADYFLQYKTTTEKHTGKITGFGATVTAGKNE